MERLTANGFYSKVSAGTIADMAKRRREITFETEKIVIRSRLREISWCDVCAALTPKGTAQQAAILIGDEPEDIFRMAECGQVHSIRTSGGVLMICLRSLLSDARK